MWSNLRFCMCYKTKWEWVWRWNGEENMQHQERIKNKRQHKADQGSRTRSSARRTEYDREEGNSSLLLLRLVGTPERHRRLPETARLVLCLALQASTRGADSLPPSACLNNRTLSEDPAAQHPRKRNKLDPT
jgi:hypothetical protein